MRQNETSETKLNWQKIGSGPNLILLHGWGMNGAVWQQTAERLSHHFCVHIVDLPGFGFSHQAGFSSMDELVQPLLDEAPQQAIWLGWSLGGLVTTHVALHAPERINGLITVASSPCFAEQKPWRGIQPKVLSAFTTQLMDDFHLTIERFIALQAMGSPSARQDLKTLKQAVLSRPSPNPQALLAGLTLLADLDYRECLTTIQAPTLRLYGRLDGLVPIQVERDMAALMPNSQSYVFSQSSHAPFMTEPDEFCQQVTEFARLHSM